MRTLALILVLTVSGTLIQAREGWQKFDATAYSREGQTASGQVTREGKTAAADPSVLPIGTRVEVADAGPWSGTYLIHDSGRKVNGRHIDLFIDDPAEAKRFGNKPVRVRVLSRPKAGVDQKK